MRNYNDLLRALAGKVVLREAEIPDRTLAIGDAEYLFPVPQVGELRADYKAPEEKLMVSKDTLGGFEGLLGEGPAVSPGDVMSGAFDLGPGIHKGAAPSWIP